MNWSIEISDLLERAGESSRESERLLREAERLAGRYRELIGERNELLRELAQHGRNFCDRIAPSAS